MKICNSLKFSILGLLMAALPSAALATPTYSGRNTIQSVVAYQSGLVVLTMVSAPSSPWSTCNVGHQFVLGTSSTGSAAIYSNIIRAQQDAKTIYVNGKGTCTQISGVEDVDSVEINP